jgi:anti-sigma factor RsiW
MSPQKNSCGRADAVRDYAFDELSAADKKSLEQHFGECPDCVAELDRLRLTTAALRVLPDREVPRRIAFVSDSSPATGWFSGFWNSAARLGFASALVLSAGLSFASFNNHRPAEVHTTVQTASVSQAEIDRAVAKAVALAVDKVHTDDARMTRAALDAVDSKYQQKQTNLMVAMESNLDYMQKQYRQSARNGFLDAPPTVRQ